MINTGRDKINLQPLKAIILDDDSTYDNVLKDIDSNINALESIFNHGLLTDRTQLKKIKDFEIICRNFKKLLTNRNDLISFLQEKKFIINNNDNPKNKKVDLIFSSNNQIKIHIDSFIAKNKDNISSFPIDELNTKLELAKTGLIVNYGFIFNVFGNGARVVDNQGGAANVIDSLVELNSFLAEADQYILSQTEKDENDKIKHDEMRQIKNGKKIKKSSVESITRNSDTENTSESKNENNGQRKEEAPPQQPPLTDFNDSIAIVSDHSTLITHVAESKSDGSISTNSIPTKSESNDSTSTNLIKQQALKNRHLERVAKLHDMFTTIYFGKQHEINEKIVAIIKEKHPILFYYKELSELTEKIQATNNNYSEHSREIEARIKDLEKIKKYAVSYTNLDNELHKTEKSLDNLTKDMANSINKITKDIDTYKNYIDYNLINKNYDKINNSIQNNSFILNTKTHSYEKIINQLIDSISVLENNENLDRDKIKKPLKIKLSELSVKNAILITAKEKFSELKDQLVTTKVEHTINDPSFWRKLKDNTLKKYPDAQSTLASLMESINNIHECEEKEKIKNTVISKFKNELKDNHSLIENMDIEFDVNSLNSALEDVYYYNQLNTVKEKINQLDHLDTKNIHEVSLLIDDINKLGGYGENDVYKKSATRMLNTKLSEFTGIKFDITHTENSSDPVQIKLALALAKKMIKDLQKKIFDTEWKVGLGGNSVWKKDIQGKNNKISLQPIHRVPTHIEKILNKIRDYQSSDGTIALDITTIPKLIKDITVILNSTEVSPQNKSEFTLLGIGKRHGETQAFYDKQRDYFNEMNNFFVLEINKDNKKNIKNK